MKILITSGATREPIDAVRFITNLSSGLTGKTLAEVFTNLGHEVVYVHGEDSQVPEAAARKVKFGSFASLNTHLESLLGHEHFDAIVHAAAVSDFSVAAVTINGQVHEGAVEGKLTSDKPIEIQLRPNFKIIDRLRSYVKKSNRTTLSVAEPAIVAFKLTDTPKLDERAAAVAKLNAGAQIDFVVHNDLSERRSPREHRFSISRNNEAVGEAASAHELGHLLEKLLRRK